MSQIQINVTHDQLLTLEDLASEFDVLQFFGRLKQPLRLRGSLKFEVGGAKDRGHSCPRQGHPKM